VTDTSNCTHYHQQRHCHIFLGKFSTGHLPVLPKHSVGKCLCQVPLQFRGTFARTNHIAKKGKFSLLAQEITILPFGKCAQSFANPFLSHFFLHPSPTALTKETKPRRATNPSAVLLSLAASSLPSLHPPLHLSALRAYLPRLQIPQPPLVQSGPEFSHRSVSSSCEKTAVVSNSGRW
jgi:hypothetical protein